MRTFTMFEKGGAALQRVSSEDGRLVLMSSAKAASGAHYFAVFRRR